MVSDSVSAGRNLKFISPEAANLSMKWFGAVGRKLSPLGKSMRSEGVKVGMLQDAGLGTEFPSRVLRYTQLPL